jgi:hypothetical protein
VLFFERLELVEKTVVFGVGDLRLVEDVIPVEVVLDLRTELGRAVFEVGSRFRRAGCHRLDRIGGIRPRRVEDVRFGGRNASPPVRWEAPAACRRPSGPLFAPDSREVSS